ncbi:helix-turn-helix transcriptional regulator [Thermithiobacillus plumbiphilus]|uniref:Helix-turn-helix transcriptional regulator n=1 Tax=Thermithiobacillus plumbiphilus TaxID=1729899 RepID=A0ABU9D545_9PROT
MNYPVKTPEQLGDVLKGCRKDMRLTQKDAGAKVGLQQRSISEIENGTAHVSVERLFKLLSALEVDLVVRTRSGASSNQTAPDW